MLWRGLLFLITVSTCVLLTVHLLKVAYMHTACLQADALQICNMLTALTGLQGQTGPFLCIAASGGQPPVSTLTHMGSRMDAPSPSQPGKHQHLNCCHYCRSRDDISHINNAFTVTVTTISITIHC